MSVGNVRNRDDELVDHGLGRRGSEAPTVLEVEVHCTGSGRGSERHVDETDAEGILDAARQHRETAEEQRSATGSDSVSRSDLLCAA